MDIDLDSRLAALFLLHQKIIDELPDNLKTGHDRQTTASWARNEIIRLRQLNAELVAVIEESIDPESIEPVGTQVWLDKVYDLLDRATGGE